MSWIAMLAAAAVGAPADVASLGWLAGSWRSEANGVVTRETWLAPLDGVMAGAAQTNRPGRPPQVEHMKISTEPAGVTFTAIVGGQAPTAFVLVAGPADAAVFENKAHDFPQRVIYRRCGADLCARIEGLLKGRLEGQDWRYLRVSP